MHGFGAVWCAVLTFFMFFVSEPHDFAFVLDPEFIFSVQTIQTSYSFCPKSPYYPFKPNSSQNFMVRDEISFFEPNRSANSYGLNRNFFSLDQKTTHPVATPYTGAFAHLIAKPHTGALAHLIARPYTSTLAHPVAKPHTGVLTQHATPKSHKTTHRRSRTTKKPPRRTTSPGRAVSFTSLFIWLLLPL